MRRLVPVLLLAHAGLLLLGLASGDYPVSPSDLVELATSSTASPDIVLIVTNIRLPRALLACLVGAALGVAGVITQAVLRNPLAEPGLLGISSGAAVGAMLAMIGFGGAFAAFVPVASFAGAAAMALAIHLLSWRDGTSSLRIILVGLGLAALANALTGFLSAFGDVRRVQQAMVWMAGSLHDADWAKVRSLAMWGAAPLVLSGLAARTLDLLGFDDDTAHGLGLRLEATRAAMILLATLLAGATVSVAGLVGFVGLAAPHLARRLVGQAHARLLPVSALVGGLMVAGADLVGRVLIPPAEIPAGLVTALVGAPLFAFLLWERRHVRG